MSTAKLAVVGPEQLGQKINMRIPAWKNTASAPTLEALGNGIADGTIDPDVDGLLIYANPGIIDATMNELGEAVNYYRAGVVVILVDDGTLDRNSLASAVAHARQEEETRNKADGAITDPETPYYILEAATPLASAHAIVEQVQRDAEALAGTAFAGAAHAFQGTVPSLAEAPQTPPSAYSVPGARAGAENAAQGHTVQITGSVTVIVAQPGAPLTYNTLTTAEKPASTEDAELLVIDATGSASADGATPLNQFDANCTLSDLYAALATGRVMRSRADLMICKPLHALTSKEAYTVGKLIDMMAPYYSTGIILAITPEDAHSYSYKKQ